MRQHQFTGNHEREFVAWALKYIKDYSLEEFLKLLKNKVGIAVDFPISALWRAWDVFETPAQRLMTKAEKIALWKAGRMETQLQAENWNKIMDAYKHAIIAQNMGTPTAAQDINIDYVAVGLRDMKATGVPPAASDGALGREFFRAVPDEKYQNSSTLVVIMYLDASEANPTNTTVASGLSNVSFVVQAAQGSNYAQHDVIRVNTGVFEVVTVDGRSTDTITLKSGTPLSVTPTALMPVQRGFGECGMFCGTASGSANTGTLVNHADLRFFKNLNTSILVEIHLNYISS